MAEDSDDNLASQEDGGDALSARIALSEEDRQSSEAREYLKKQSRIADLNLHILKKKHEYELSHLRFRRFSDYAKFALEVAVFLVVVLVVGGLATMVWNASQDHDLVVDAFSVPQDVADTGLTGSVLAGRVLDRFGRMQSETRAFTQAMASTRAEGKEEVRVEIPQTGISFGELNHYLRGWLGHEVHVSGDLVRTPNRNLALTVRYGDEPGITFMAAAANLDKLTEEAAEHILSAALPYRHIEYLEHNNRFAEASALLPELVARGDAAEKAIAYTAWAKIYFWQGDVAHALETGAAAVRLDPRNPNGWGWIGATELDVGHDERSYRNDVTALKLYAANGDTDETLWLHQVFIIYCDELTGDLLDAVGVWSRLNDKLPLGALRASWTAARDAAADHDLKAARGFASMMAGSHKAEPVDPQGLLAQFYVRLGEEDWAGARKLGDAALAILNTQFGWRMDALTRTPDVAYAAARADDLKAADALVDRLPEDCDPCMRVRGQIAALEHRWSEATHDFALVAARSPHTPYAESDWGQMLLGRGEYDDAIAKFREANLKGPHYADPLEMWGEALIAKNRSDLALAKFAEANKYAPNWGRLHLEWGKALTYAGKNDEAMKQFTIAAGLDLATTDRVQLSKLPGGKS